jgi:hypothetical protein
VTERVIKRLEIVKVNQEDGAGSSTASNPFICNAELFREISSVSQTGEMIMERLVSQSRSQQIHARANQ